MRRFWLLLGLLPTLAQAANLLANSSFELGEPKGAPAGWRWSVNGAAQAVLHLDSPGHSGPRCLRLSSQSAFAPNVYGHLEQTVKVAPATTYTLSCFVRGTHMGRAWFGGGPGWLVRQDLAPGAAWHRVQVTFKTPADGDEWTVVVNVDDVTDGFWIDDLQLELGAQASEFTVPKLLGAGEVELSVTPLGAGRNLLPNGSFEALGPDGRPTDWIWGVQRADATLTVTHPGRSGNNALQFTNATDQSPHIYARLYRDAVPVRPNTPYSLSFWCRSGAGLGVAWVGGGPDWNWRVRVPETAGEWRRVTQSFVTGEQTSVPLMLVTESTTTPFELDDVQFEQGSASTPFDDPALKLPPSLDLIPSLGGADGLLLHAARWMPDRYPTDQWAFGDGALSLEGIVNVPQGGDTAHLELELLVGGQRIGLATTPAGVPARGQVHVRCGLTDPPPAELTIACRLLGPGAAPALATVQRTLHLVGRGSVTQLLAEATAQLPPLVERAQRDDDARVTATTVQWFLDWCREDLANGQVDRAFDTARRLSPLMAQALARPARPAAPRFVTSPLKLIGPTFEGQTALPDGTRATRPVYFSGFGHFNAVRQMVDQFPRIGVNIIQIELGPSAVMPTETTFDEQPVKDFLAVCDRAARANVQVNLLLSPHYFPAWALAKWPDLKPFNGGFLQYKFHDPRAKGVLERFLRYVIPKVKDHPALHSLCLSNEPLCIDQSQCQTAVAMWRDWLARTFGAVTVVNQRWDTKYTAFTEIPIPPARFEGSALVYDYTRFNQEAFAGWHGQMARIVHELAPNVPVHAKIMVFACFGGGLAGPWSVSPELMAGISQINGNDCIKWPGVSGEFACDWVTENLGYDAQRSAADLPVFNSENHLILDRCVTDVSPEFIQNVLWQGAIHGQGATTTWVWERTNQLTSDFTGSIMHRPQCVDAYGRTALDLNRFSREVAALAAEPATLGVLWSHASCVWRGGATGDLQRAYTALNFTDRPVAVVTERDCEAYAAGKPNRAWSHLKLLVAPATTHVPPAVMAALAKFRQAGGQVVELGDCFDFDDAGKPRPLERDRKELVPSFAKAGAAQAKPRDVWERLRPVVDTACGAAALPVSSYGVETRAITVDGHRVANLVNYLRQPVTVSLPAGATDLLTGKSLGTTLELAPLAPVLAQW